MARNDRLSNYRTTWWNKDNQGGVTYHNTQIVAWKDNKVTLNVYVLPLFSNIEYLYLCYCFHKNEFFFST